MNNLLSTKEKQYINLKHMMHMVIVDPAKTVKVHSADSAIVGVSVAESTSAIFIRDVIAGKMYPDELYNEMFGMVTRLNAHALGVEVTSLNQFISQPIKNEMVSRRIAVHYVELKAQGKKEDRIAHLAPYYRMGIVYHNSSCCNKLELQLRSFPLGRRVDIIDALAYVPKLLDILDTLYGIEGGYYNVEHEYDDLDYDEPLEMELLV